MSNASDRSDIRDDLVHLFIATPQGQVNFLSYPLPTLTASLIDHPLLWDVLPLPIEIAKAKASEGGRGDVKVPNEKILKISAHTLHP